MDQIRGGTGAMWQRMCRDTDGDPWKNLGDGARGQGPPIPTCAVNAAAEEDPAPVQSRYRRAAASQRGTGARLPSREGRRLAVRLAVAKAAPLPQVFTAERVR